MSATPKRGLARLGWLAGLAITLFLNATSAGAQSADERTAQALARAQGLLRQIGEQKARLESENAKLKAETARTEKRLKAAKGRISELEGELETAEQQGDRLDARLQATRDRLEQTRSRLENLIGEYKKLSAAHKALTEKQQNTAEALSETQEALQASEFNNVQLYQVNADLLELLGSKRWYKMMLQKEPFTGIMNVKVQNIIEQYRAKQYEFLNLQNVDKVDEAGGRSDKD